MKFPLSIRSALFPLLRLVTQLAGMCGLGLFVVSCNSSTIEYFDPSDAALISKLQISAEDWRSLTSLSAREKRVIIKDVGRVGPDLIEIEFKNPDDTANDEGGVVNLYQKTNGTWKKRTDFVGEWAAGYGK